MELLTDLLIFGSFIIQLTLQIIDINDNFRELFFTLSQIAGLRCTLPPLGSTQDLVHTRTPKHDFFKIFTLWLLVFLIAHPDECLRASSQSVRKARRTCPSDHSVQRSNSVIYRREKKVSFSKSSKLCLSRSKGRNQFFSLS